MKKTFISVASCIALMLCLVGCTVSGTSNSSQEDNGAAGQEASSAENTLYYAGVYIVGENLPAGSYLLTQDDGADDAYVHVYIDETMTTSVFWEYFEGKYQVYVSDGQALEVKRATFVSSAGGAVPPSGSANSDEAETPEPESAEPAAQSDTTYPAGIYKVGTDIPAGGYLVTTEEAYMTGDPGSNDTYVRVYSDSTQKDEVVFKAFEGEFFVSVTNGQLLEVERGTFAAA